MFNSTLSPVLLSLGQLEIRYYGLFYVIGIILAYYLILYLAKKKLIKINKDQTENLLVYAGVGGIIGGRLFYVLVYNLQYYLQNPFEILAVWHGGLSVHGGLIGGIIGIYLFCKKYKFKFLEILDLIAIPFTLAHALGRIGNFINGELYGRITDVSWCVNFPSVEGCRHPSQIYFAIANMVNFSILWVLKDKKLKKGSLFSIFLILNSIFRFNLEFLREPDPQLGFITLGLSMGQIISVIMLIIGVVLYLRINKKSMVT